MITDIDIEHDKYNVDNCSSSPPRMIEDNTNKSRPSLLPSVENQKKIPLDTQTKSRTVFTTKQKEEMIILARKIGWKSESKRGKEEKEEVENFIKHSGVGATTFKIWMQNNRNANATTLGSSSMVAEVNEHDKENVDINKILHCSLENEEAQRKGKMSISPSQKLVPDHALPTVNKPLSSLLPSSSSTQMMTKDNINTACKLRKSRTIFTTGQKDEMRILAERIGWKMQSKRKREDEEVESFINRIGVSRERFKLWMKNHKESNVLAQSTAISPDSYTFNYSSSISIDVNDERANENEVIDRRALEKTQKNKEICIEITPPLQKLVSYNTPMVNKPFSRLLPSSSSKQQLVEDYMVIEDDSGEDPLPVYISNEIINQASSSSIKSTQDLFEAFQTTVENGFNVHDEQHQSSPTSSSTPPNNV